MKFKTLLLNCFLATGLASTALAQDGWIQLFNGTNLDGWVEHSGKAKYTVEDGVLVGETVNGTGNSFLCTTRTYSNFELELDYQADPLLNSGVQIRSDVFPGARTLNIDGKAIKLPPDRIHGYQCEIDMDKARGRMWTGGIYDEAKRSPPRATPSANPANGIICASSPKAIPSKPGSMANPAPPLLIILPPSV